MPRSLPVNRTANHIVILNHLLQIKKMFTGEKIRDIWFSDVSIKFLAHSTVSPLMVTWFGLYYKMADIFKKINLFSINCKYVKNCYEEQCVTYNIHLLLWVGNYPWFFWYNKLIRFDAQNNSVILTCSLIYSTNNDTSTSQDRYLSRWCRGREDKALLLLAFNVQKEKQTVDNEKNDWHLLNNKCISKNMKQTVQASQQVSHIQWA